LSHNPSHAPKNICADNKNQLHIFVKICSNMAKGHTRIGERLMRSRLLAREGLRAHIKRCGVVASILVFCIGVFAGASYGRDAYSHKDGAHRGDLTVTRAYLPLEPKDYMADFRLVYALWTLTGEPVQDFTFSWKRRPGALHIGSCAIGDRTVSVSSAMLAKYPDLLKKFNAVKPVSVELDADIYLDAARGKKHIKPDFISPAGKAGVSMSPDSPDWADFYESIYGYDTTDKATRANIHRKAWREAKSVELRDPKIVKIEWPESELQAIADEYGKRERPKEKAKKGRKEPALNPLEKAEAAVGTAPETSRSPATAASPLERMKAGINSPEKQRGSENPLEKAARLKEAEVARQEQVRIAAEKEKARLEAEKQAQAKRRPFTLTLRQERACHDRWGRRIECDDDD
jgi:hypothetical protein